VESQEDKNGQLVLSHKKARTLKAWDNVNNALKNEEVIKGFVKCRTKGGLIVDVFGIEAFLPGSQIDVKPIRDYDMYVGKAMEFKVVKINQEFRNVVVSHKALIEAELEQQKAEIISKLEKGQVLEGTVKNITSYGVFIDLGGVDGLIHITDLSWGRINHPEEIVELDQKLNVVILDFDDEKKRIALGLKQLSKHPWEALDENLKVGDTVNGKVVVLADYGAFVEIAPGVEGLIHVSEMSWSQHLRTAQDFFKVGDAVEAVIMTLDREERKMSLSTRRLTPDPWEAIESKYPVESRHTAKVTNLSNFGVFVELEEGIDGLVHISDLSWSKKINHPGEVTKVGEDMEVVVLEIDKDNRRLSLGHKQLEENPWNVFETVFTLGSVHKGTILSKTDKGGIVALPYGVEGFAPNRHLMKEDGKRAEADETLDFEVLEFNKDAKKIIVSHTRLHEAASKAERDAENKRQKAEQSATRKKVQNMNEKVERTTLGDLSVLASLKSEMEDAEKAAKPTASKKAAPAKKAEKAPEAEDAGDAKEGEAEA
ncbi:MAG: 30S ribosomal protein S1, partial [Salibacteraceae bacterium]